MATFVITSTGNSFEVVKDGESTVFPKGVFNLQLNGGDPNELTSFNKYKSQNEYVMYTDTDYINVDGEDSWANAEDLKAALQTIMFIPAGGSSPGVSSFNGRTGDVIPQTGDYSVSQINGAAALLSGESSGITGALNGITNYIETFTVTGAVVGDFVSCGFNDVFYDDLKSSAQDSSIIAKVVSDNNVEVLFRIEQFLAENTNRKVWARILK